MDKPTVERPMDVIVRDGPTKVWKDGVVGGVMLYPGVPRFDDPANATEGQKACVTDEDIRRMDPETVRALGLGHRLNK